jgi:hypothetical protein
MKTWYLVVLRKAEFRQIGENCEQIIRDFIKKEIDVDWILGFSFFGCIFEQS